MTTEITVVRLPGAFSDLVDDVVKEFVESWNNEHLLANRRYHDADLWMVYSHRSLQANGPGFVTYRVTIGAFSDQPGRLKFIPDIVLTTPTGRFTVMEQEEAGGPERFLPIDFLGQVLAFGKPASFRDPDMALLLEEFDHHVGPPWGFWGLPESSNRVRSIIKRMVRHRMTDAWAAAHELSEVDATQPIL